MSILRKKIDKLHEEIETKNADLNSLVATLQAKCKHLHTVKAPYSPETSFSHASADIQVCKQCGIIEDGWGCGYNLLAKPKSTQHVTREEAYKLRNSIIGTKHQGDYTD